MCVLFLLHLMSFDYSIYKYVIFPITIYTWESIKWSIVWRQLASTEGLFIYEDIANHWGWLFMAGAVLDCPACTIPVIAWSAVGSLGTPLVDSVALCLLALSPFVHRSACASNARNLASLLSITMDSRWANQCDQLGTFLECRWFYRLWRCSVFCLAQLVSYAALALVDRRLPGDGWDCSGVVGANDLTQCTARVLYLFRGSGSFKTRWFL